MTFSLHQGRVVISSQITHTHSHQQTPHSPHTWHLRLGFHNLLPFWNLFQSHYVPAFLPSPGDNHHRKGERSERTLWQAKMAAWNSFSYICTRALHSFRSFAHCRAPSTVIPLLPKSTFTLSSRITVSFAPVLHLLRPSIPFWSYGTHLFFHRAQTISILSDLLYSLTKL